VHPVDRETPGEAGGEIFVFRRLSGIFAQIREAEFVSAKQNPTAGCIRMAMAHILKPPDHNKAPFPRRGNFSPSARVSIVKI
jgi:hypothetical protein